MEKPLGVDPVGVRSIMETAERADAFNLCVATGTQYRHTKSFIETYNRLQDGAIGDIVAARGYTYQLVETLPALPPAAPSMALALQTRNTCP